MSLLFYRRPDYVAKSPGYLDQSACQKYVERSKDSRGQIPEDASFDRVVENKTKPVRSCCTF